MDGEFEATTLDMFIHWNHHTFPPTFLHSDVAFLNFEETITELAAVPTSSSHEASSRVPPLTFVPNPLPHLPPARSNPPLSSAVPYVPPRRGRPPKRRDPVESYSQRAKALKIFNTAKGGSSSTSQRGQRPPDIRVSRKHQNALLPNLPSAPRHFDNAAYQMEFERQGQLLDPISEYYSNDHQRTNVPKLL